jgi:hypothetical protein
MASAAQALGLLAPIANRRPVQQSIDPDASFSEEQ